MARKKKRPKHLRDYERLSERGVAPTPEWIAKHGDRAEISGTGRGEVPSIRIRHYSPYEVIQDLLPHDHTLSLRAYLYLREQYERPTDARAGLREDVSGRGVATMPFLGLLGQLKRDLGAYREQWVYHLVTPLPVTLPLSPVTGKPQTMSDIRRQLQASLVPIQDALDRLDAFFEPHHELLEFCRFDGDA